MIGTGGLRQALRQRGQHREFRIEPPAWGAAEQARLEQLIAELPPAVDPPAVDPSPADPSAADPPDTAIAEMPATGVADTPDQNGTGGLDDKALATAATNLWRALRRLEPPEGAQARHTRHYLRRGHEALAEAGLVVRDHDGELFHPGRSLEVLAYQEDPTVSEETVTETERPSVYLGDRQIQPGRVVVGRPSGRHNPEGDIHRA